MLTASTSVFKQLQQEQSDSKCNNDQQAVREATTICLRPLQVDLWPFDLENGVRVTCDLGYLCADFSLPRPLCSRLRPDVRDRQMSWDVRRAYLRPISVEA